MRRTVDLVLERTLHFALSEGGGSPPARLTDALAYAVFPGGARVRPRLCLEVARASGVTTDLAYAAAASVELLHCASLVHDDLPCFDDGETRRGHPSVHRVYGDATAVLVGDGLIVASFETLTRALAARPEVGYAPLLALLAAAGARRGLVAGQAWELEKEVDLAAYHRAKTASLFEASAELGALVSGVPASPFASFGRTFGMAYQLADDVADVLGDSALLGKPTGRDQELGRPTAMRNFATAEAALGQLDCAGLGAVDAVPDCAGAGELRGFVEAVFDALSVAVRARRTDPRRMAAVAVTSAGAANAVNGASAVNGALNGAGLNGQAAARRGP